MNARMLAAGAALVLLLPAPGARSEGEDDAGAACAFVATLEELPSRPPQGPRVRHTGLMTAGPWVLTTPGGTVVSIGCSVQADSDDPNAPDLFRAGADGAYMPPKPISFETPAWETPVFLCTEVVVRYPPNPPEPPRRYDADPDTPGAQCQKAERRHDELVVAEVGTPAVDWYVCVQLDGGSIPYLWREVCNPLNP